MKTHEISFIDTFYNEVLDVPKSVQKQLSRVIRGLQTDPFSDELDVKRLKGFKGEVYRARIGDYRLLYGLGQGWVKLLSVRKRDDQTYERSLPTFQAPTAVPDLPALESKAETAASSLRKATTSSLGKGKSAPQQLPVSMLPRRIDEELLRQWRIPEEHWEPILSLHNAEQILELPIPHKYVNRLLDNLYPRPDEDLEARPEFVLANPNDLARFIDGSLTAFLLRLDPDQERLLDFGGKGPTLVKGGPGSGKSTLALYRAKAYVEKGMTPVLFTTYTNALVEYSRQLLTQLLGADPEALGIRVTTFDKLTREVYEQNFVTPRIAGDTVPLECLEEALESADLGGVNALDRKARRQTLERLGPQYLLEEFNTIIEGFGLSSLDEYRETPRIGRVVRLKPNVREAIWALYRDWCFRLRERGLTTFEQVRRMALYRVTESSEKPFGAIVVDEAQDLSPLALRFLASLVRSPQGIYLTADSSQSLYQRGFTWKQVHDDLRFAGRTAVLKRNYRNTRQITAACASILAGSEAGDAESIAQEPASWEGDVPTVLLTDDPERMAGEIVRFLREASKRFRLPAQASGILCRNADAGRPLAKALTTAGIKARYMNSKSIDLSADCVKVLSIRAAKGLELPFVVVTGLQEGELPSVRPGTPADEMPAALDEQRRLLYVGCSRAMRALLVCGSASNPSPFLCLLREPEWNVRRLDG